MIGLSFLAVGLLWLALAFYLTFNLPGWLGLKKGVWPLRAVLLPLLLVGPFVDHIVGMRQFEKLCTEQTTLAIHQNAASAKRGIDRSTAAEPLNGYAIPILRRTDSLVNAETGEAILRYNHFSTQGGRIGRMARMGGVYECAAFQSNHLDHDKYRALRKQIEIIHGERK